MSDSIPAEIYIGGALKPEAVEEFLEAINADAPGLDYDGSVEFDDLESLRQALDDDGQLHFMDNQARNGVFEHIEDFCTTHGLFFQRHSDAKFEYDAQWVVLAPGMKESKWYPATQNGGVVTSDATLTHVRKKLKQLHNNIGARIRKKQEINGPATLRCLQHLLDKIRHETELPEIPAFTFPEVSDAG